MPTSRQHVLGLLSRFQSSIESGEPPLETLVSKSAGLSAPGSESRRAAPNRAAVAAALSANFIDPALHFDPLEVSVLVGADAEVMTVPLETAAMGALRRIVLSLELGYDDGVLRIQDITLSRSP